MRPIQSVTAAIKTAAVAVALCSGAIAEAAFIPVDLTTFTADAPVSVSADGSSATFVESSALGPVTLFSDLLLPSDATALSFDYRLDVPDSSNEDFLSFFFGDLGLPAFSDGGVGPQVFSGTHNTSVVGAAGTTAPVLFSLGFGFGDVGLDSMLTVSNLAIETADTGFPVPAPGAFWLLLAGGPGLALIRRRSHRLADEATAVHH